MIEITSKEKYQILENIYLACFKEFRNLDSHLGKIDSNDLKKEFDLADVFKTPRVVYTYTQNNIVMGYIVFNPTSNEDNIYHLYIDPQYQSRGVGAKLLNHVIDKIPKNNQRETTVYVFEYNQKAIEFYQKYGFVIVESGLNHELLSGLNISYCKMVKKIA